MTRKKTTPAATIASPSGRGPSGPPAASKTNQAAASASANCAAFQTATDPDLRRTSTSVTAEPIAMALIATSGPDVRSSANANTDPVEKISSGRAKCWMARQSPSTTQPTKASVPS